MKHISLFSGMGGFDLAAELMGWENVAHCEINKFNQKILKYYWPNAISYEDITKTDFTRHRGAIDILTGGFPCQGFSLAGQRLGTDDDRYLWPENLRVVDEVQPPWILGENVTGILSMEDKSGIHRDVFPKVENRKVARLYPIDEYEAVYTRQAKMLVNSICESLEERGYEVQTFAIPAAAVGAPHKRERIWFIAYSADNHRRRTQSGFDEAGKHIFSQSERFSSQRDTSETATNSDNARAGIDMRNDRERQEENKGRERQPQLELGKNSSNGITTNSDSEQRCKGRMHKDGRKEAERYVSSCHSWHEGKAWDNFPTQSPVCYGDDELSERLDSITFSKWRKESIMAGGNAVVPALVYEIFKAIEETEKLLNTTK